MKALKENYSQNVKILKENLKRGMSQKHASEVINNFENQFIKAGLYNESEKDFINEMRKEVIENFTSMKVEIIK